MYFDASADDFCNLFKFGGVDFLDIFWRIEIDCV